MAVYVYISLVVYSEYNTAAATPRSCSEYYSQQSELSLTLLYITEQSSGIQLYLYSTEATLATRMMCS